MNNYSENIYRLVDVLDRQGNRRAEQEGSKHRDFYKDLIGCLVRNIREDTWWQSSARIMRVDVMQDPDGQWINRNFRTSPLREIRETENGGLEIVTKNSVYVFEPGELKPLVYQDEADLIELYLCDENYQFAAGFYYDAEKKPHPLVGSVHLGTFQDSVMVCLQEEPGICTCRFFPKGPIIEFYNTLYQQQDYSRRLLIHNTGKIPLEIRFEFFQGIWTIQPGESKMIWPFCADDANEGYTEPTSETT